MPVLLCGVGGRHGEYWFSEAASPSAWLLGTWRPCLHTPPSSHGIQRGKLSQYVASGFSRRLRLTNIHS